MANYKDIKYNFAASSTATGVGGAWNLIKTQTVSTAVAAVDFIDGTSSVVFDSTYEMYLITYMMVHPSVQKPELQWAPGDGDFTDDKHSALYVLRSNNTEADVDGGGEPGNIAVLTGYDDSAHSNSKTAGQIVCNNVGFGNDQSCSGHIYISDVGETDTWKSFLADGVGDSMGANDEMESVHCGGIIRQTGAIDRFRFDFSSGNIDAGTFSLYGLAKS